MEIVQKPYHVWPTSFWIQYRMLTWRQFKQSKGTILDHYEVISALIMAVVGGMIYFQTEYSYRTLRDKMGTVSFDFHSHYKI